MQPVDVTLLLGLHTLSYNVPYLTQYIYICGTQQVVRNTYTPVQLWSSFSFVPLLLLQLLLQKSH